MSVKPVKTLSVAAQQPQPPLTNGFPLIGSLPSLLRRKFDFLLEAQQRYGDIYTLNLGMLKWVMLHHPRHTEHVLVSNSQNYRKGGALWETLRDMMGNGLVVSEGDFWLRQRRMIQPQFHRQRLAALTETMVAATHESLDEWEPAARAQQPYNVVDGFSATTMRVIVRSLFGQGLDRADLERTSSLVTYALDFLMLGSATSSLPKWVPVPGAKRFQESIRELDQIVYSIIAKERAATTPSDSMLAMLVQMVDNETGEQMTDAQLRDEVMTFFVAGYETTSLALAWIAHFLTQHPHVMDKLQDEIEQVLGGRTPTFADLPALQYTKMVIQEAMRLRPPSWWVPRTALADDVIDGFFIPAGTTVVSFTYGVHHNPGVWEDPQRFDPERFAMAREGQRHRLAWVPFGAGQRQCIGRDFSIMEAQIILAMLIQRFSLSAVAGHTATLALSASLRPKDGVMVNLIRRG